MGRAVRDVVIPEEEEEEEERRRRMSEESVLYVKVMTDEQMEVLRRQISVYATICEQLVEMHKAVTAQQDSISGMRLGTMYSDPLLTSNCHKITTRPRWTPTPVQLQILENIFDQGNGTPSKQKIKEITSELSQHGQISETNVYNWFQNRRARSKRKHQVSNSNNNNTESEVETEVDSPKEKKAKLENIQCQENMAPRQDDLCFQIQGISSELHPFDPQPSKAPGPFSLDETSKPSGNVAHISFYENVLSSARMDHHLVGKMGGPGSYNPFRAGGGYDMIG